MSNIGFRTQFLGFNKMDVTLYLDKIQRDFKEKEQESAKKLADTVALLENCTKRAEQLEKEFEEVSAKLEYYSGKESEIEKTSISIATMYLVAKQNADEMLNTAKAAAKEISELSKKQLDAADVAGQSLESIRASLSDSSTRFDNEISAITESLKAAREKLEIEQKNLENKDIIEITDGGEN